VSFFIFKHRLVYTIVSAIYFVIFFFLPSLRASNYYLLLLDSSGSMRNNDPKQYHKLAAQALTSFLTSDDKVAIVKFDTNAKVLLEWTSPTQKEKIFKTINQIKCRGVFTDFRAGLEKALILFNQVSYADRKIIFLLSDGKFEPNLKSDVYAPYYLEYIKAIWGRKGEEKKRIKKEFTKKILPIAKRIVRKNVLSKCKEKDIEIFTIAFGEGADKEYLRYLADMTTKNSTELHSFYVKKPLDLIEVFSQMLVYWKSLSILHTEFNHIKPHEWKEIFIDNFTKDIFFLVVIDGKGNFCLHRNGVCKKPILYTHSNLLIIPTNSGVWKYGFDAGKGNYKLLILGKSLLKIIAEGLKKQYECTEKVRTIVRLKLGNRDARAVLISPLIRAKVCQTSCETVSLSPHQEGFQFEYQPKISGRFTLKFILYAKDLKRKEILPRPTKEYQFEVKPCFYVEPTVINFGNLRRGQIKSTKIHIISRLPKTIKVQIEGKVNIGKECLEKPIVENLSFNINPGEEIEKEFFLKIPSKTCWGDFEGVVNVKTNYSKYSSQIIFTFHIPSLWEQLTWPALFVLLGIFVIFTILLWCWGLKPTPKGILSIEKAPLGEPLTFYKLSTIKKGISRWLWNKNKIVIGRGGRRVDISLRGLRTPSKIQLLFYRFSKVSFSLQVYLTNLSSTDIYVKKDKITYTVKPTQSFRLDPGSIIMLEDYQIKYI